jgi:hypothetical protein
MPACAQFWRLLKSPQNGMHSLLDTVNQSPTAFLDVVDYLLRDTEGARADHLELMLVEAGSGWCVTADSAGGYRLTERVSEGVALAFDESTRSASDRLAAYLSSHRMEPSVRA